MNKYTNIFTQYCLTHFDLSEIEYLSNYQSLTVCIIDSVYSLRTKYRSVTQPIVKRYADVYLNGDINAKNDTISMFINRIDRVGKKEFANEILKNRQLSGGVPKIDVCYQLAKYLLALHIETIDDFKNFSEQKLLEVVIKSVKGIGNAGTNYLFMLAGDANKCKPDVHIHHCIKDACGKDISDDECQILFTETVKNLKTKNPNLTVRALDNIIWRAYSSK